MNPPSASRRAFIRNGALFIGFALGSRAAALAAAAQRGAPGGAAAPRSLTSAPYVDSWLRIDATGITVLTGKAELGQGIATALVQLAAAELRVPASGIRLISADTALTPDEGYTAGSHSMQDSGTAIRAAAAQAREILIALAAERLSLPAERLRVDAGAVHAEDGSRITYRDLVARGDPLHAAVRPRAAAAQPSAPIGESLPRIDLPGKLTGGAAFVHDLRLPDMVHARRVMPPSYGARLRALAGDALRELPGVLQLVQNGNFLAVVAEREYQAVRALAALERAAQWEEVAQLPEPTRLFEDLTARPGRTIEVGTQHAPADATVRTVAVEYRRPYQMHGSIGPSCAVALFQNGALTVWTHSQGVYPLRAALAELLGLPPAQVRCIQLQGAGCYGHNGADDAAADAALVARAFPGRPVRLQWMREQEHTCEPYGPAMLARVRAGLDANGEIVSWDYEVASNTHSTRPGGGAWLMAAWYLQQPLVPPAPRPIPLPEGGGDRNAWPAYRIASLAVRYRFIETMPIRVSALRSLGAYLNVFAIESCMDELAQLIRTDPVAFRMRHLDDPRALAVLTAAARRFGWTEYRRAVGRGRGIAFARYKNLAAYAAVAVEIELDRDSGRVRLVRAAAAVDCGEIVNPDGVRNQIEGAILQSASWTLYEAVRFDRKRITSRDWSGYPILRFPDVPERIDVELIERPGLPFLGVGEAAQGPAGAAIANAIADAAGVRLREIPLCAERVRTALGP